MVLLLNNSEPRAESAVQRFFLLINYATTAGFCADGFWFLLFARLGTAVESLHHTPRTKEASIASESQRIKAIQVTKLLEAGLSRERMASQNSTDAMLPATSARAACMQHGDCRAAATQSCALREQPSGTACAPRCSSPRKRRSRVFAPMSVVVCAGFLHEASLEPQGQ